MCSLCLFRGALCVHWGKVGSDITQKTSFQAEGHLGYFESCFNCRHLCCLSLELCLKHVYECIHFLSMHRACALMCLYARQSPSATHQCLSYLVLPCPLVSLIQSLSVSISVCFAFAWLYMLLYYLCLQLVFFLPSYCLQSHLGTLLWICCCCWQITDWTPIKALNCKKPLKYFYFLLICYIFS